MNYSQKALLANANTLDSSQIAKYNLLVTNAIKLLISSTDEHFTHADKLESLAYVKSYLFKVGAYFQTKKLERALELFFRGQPK